MKNQPILDALAAAVADGIEVDWDALAAQHGDPAVAAVVRNLRMLSTIEVEHRHAVGAGQDRLAGTTWGHLRVIERVGSGAFGDVYRAWDPQLEREVALKLVPLNAAGSDRDGSLGEARLLARVRHPHVVTVYGGATIDGYSGLWMEFVDGRTLRQVIEQDGPFGAPETVIAGLAICRALGAIHAAGLLHGDVKAQNVMRERGGRLVLMDLGAGRLLAPAEGASSPVAATPLYVAPEVLAGEPPDVRSDVYSLGVVLFFLLTGRFPHRGSDAADIAESHLRGDGNLLRELRTDLPDALVSVVERCLAVQPEARFEQAAAVERALASCLSAHVEHDPRTIGWRPSRVLAAGTVVVALAGVVGWRVMAGVGRDDRADVRVRSVIALSPPVANTYGPWLALSSHGRWIAYRAHDAQLYIRRVDRLDPVQVPRSYNAVYPFFSPDEQWLAFFARGVLLKYSLVDGTVARITDAPNARGGTWTTDGWIVYTPTLHAGLWRVRESGGAPEQITWLRRGEASHRWPVALPGGRFALTTWPTHGDILDATVAIVDPPSQQWWTIGKGTRPQYSNNGMLAYAHDGEVLATPYDTLHPELTKPGVPLQGSVLTDEQTGYVDYGISDDTLLYVHGGSNSEQRRLVWVNQSGTNQPTSIPVRSIERPRIAPDGRQVAFVVRERRTDLYHYDLDRGVLTRLTSSPAAEHEAPEWSPDSSRLVYSKWIFGAPRAIVLRKPDEADQGQVIGTANTHDHVTAWSRHGGLMVTAFNEQGLGDILVVDDRPAGGRQPFLATDANERDGQPSPDGMWVLYTSDESGTDQVYVRERSGGRRIQISSAGGSEPIWQRDGRAIFYRSTDAMMKVRWPLLGSASEPRPLFKDTYVRSTRREVNYSVTPDGQRFLMVEALPPPHRPLTLVIGWLSDLQLRLARAGSY
jgi:eukaryotic-like serine/threonine-protein kinase